MYVYIYKTLVIGLSWLYIIIRLVIYHKTSGLVPLPFLPCTWHLCHAILRQVTGQTLRSDSTFRLDVQTNKSETWTRAVRG